MLIMLPAVNFDYQLRFQTDEIQYVSAKGVLPAEL